MLGGFKRGNSRLLGCEVRLNSYGSAGKLHCGKDPAFRKAGCFLPASRSRLAGLQEPTKKPGRLVIVKHFGDGLGVEEHVFGA